MNTLPKDITDMVMTYRGTDTFEALSHEMDTVKKATKKWRTDMLDRIIGAWDDGITTHEYKILIKVLNRKCPSPKGEKVTLVGIHPDA